MHRSSTVCIFPHQHSSEIAHPSLVSLVEHQACTICTLMQLLSRQWSVSCVLGYRPSLVGCVVLALEIGCHLSKVDKARQQVSQT